MYRIRRFGVMKTATVVAVMYMVIVAIFVVPFGLLGLLVAGSQGTNGAGAAGGIVAFGLLAIFGYGLAGWVFTAIAAAIYNVAARWVGGIVVEIEAVAPPPPMPVWGTTAAAPAPSYPAAPPPPPVPPPAPTDPAG
jgi:hypothetical protein